MSSASDDIVQAALQLPASERAHVVQSLLESFSPDAETLLDDAWVAELDRRVAEFQEGKMDAVPWTQLKESI